MHIGHIITYAISTLRIEVEQEKKCLVMVMNTNQLNTTSCIIVLFYTSIFS